MGTISDKLAYLANTKSAIKAAIVAKGVSVADTDTFRAFAEKIAAIEGGGGGETEYQDALKTLISGTEGNVTALNVPDGVKTIRQYGFYDVPFSQVTLPASLTEIGSSGFYSSLIETVDLSKTAVTEFNTFAFWACRKLVSVKLPPALTSIGSSAFGLCSALASIDLPDSLVSIGSGAFSSSGLKAITIPPNVTSIGSQFLSSCSSLKTVTMKPSVPPALDKFSTLANFPTGNDGFVIYVPQGSLSAYQTATNWTEVADYMIEY